MAPATEALRTQEGEDGKARPSSDASNTEALANCGGGGQDFRAALLGPGYVALVDDATGNCLTAQGNGLAVTECTHAKAQQFSFTSSAAGYQFVSLDSGLAMTADLKLGSVAGKIEIRIRGNADPLAVVVDEGPIGFATEPLRRHLRGRWYVHAILWVLPRRRYMRRDRWMRRGRVSTNGRGILYRDL